MRRVITFAIFAVALTACTDPDAAREALDGAGYTNVTIKEPGWFNGGCAESDSTTTPFTATGPSGATVDDVVCGTSGWGKGSTIRILKVTRPGAKS